MQVTWYTRIAIVLMATTALIRAGSGYYAQPGIFLTNDTGTDLTVSVLVADEEPRVQEIKDDSMERILLSPDTNVVGLKLVDAKDPKRTWTFYGEPVAFMRGEGRPDAQPGDETKTGQYKQKYDGFFNQRPAFFVLKRDWVPGRTRPFRMQRIVKKSSTDVAQKPAPKDDEALSPEEARKQLSKWAGSVGKYLREYFGL